MYSHQFDVFQNIASVRYELLQQIPQHLMTPAQLTPLPPPHSNIEHSPRRNGIYLF